MIQEVFRTIGIHLCSLKLQADTSNAKDSLYKETKLNTKVAYK